MKKKSPPYAILVAAFIGLIGIFFLYKWKQQMDASSDAKVAAATKTLQDEIDQLKAAPQVSVAPTPTDMRKVYYATQPIEAGAKISPAFYEEKLTPNDVLADAYGEGADIVGFYAIRPIEKGDPLTPHNVDKTLPYLSERLPQGMRALALPIFNDRYNNTGSFAVDGDFVDLLFTTMGTVAGTGQTGEFNTQTVLQNVQILFIPGPQTRSDTTVGLTPAPAPGEPLSVVFLVTPEEAQMLVHLAGGGDSGRFSMILRGRNDKQENKLRPYVVNDLTNLKDVQKQTDRSYARVAQLQKEIEAEEQKEKDQAAAQGNTNETNHPSPPSP